MQEKIKDDLISRQAAIDALGEKPLAWTEGEYELGLQRQWESDVEAIKELPSAEPQRKKGKWIKWGSEVKCSQCDLCNPVEKPFCPNCGADMRGGQDEGD